MSGSRTNSLKDPGLYLPVAGDHGARGDFGSRGARR